MNVYYNWGRWIVPCPSANCVGEILLDLETRRDMAVCDCRDESICQHGPICATLIPVVWPDDPEAIVGLTVNRPIPNRNWYPHESIDDLRAENELHGVDA